MPGADETRSHQTRFHRSRPDRTRELQKQGLTDLVRFGQPRFTDTWFPYTSGEVGPYYIQSIAVEGDGAAYRRAVDALCELAELTVGVDGFDAVSGGESRDWDFSNPVAASLSKPHIKIYKNGRLLGAEPAGARILHVADLNNQGSSMRDIWEPTLREAGGKLVGALFFVDRLEDGVGVLRDLGIPTASVVPLDEAAWAFLRDIEYISDDLYASLRRRLEDKHAWGIEALRSHIEPLGEMLESTDEREISRGRRILDVGYPQHREELLDILNRRGFDVDD